MTPVDAIGLARSGPLIPVAGIIVLALMFGFVALVASRRPVRERWAWLLPEIGVAAALTLLHILFFWQPYRTPALVPRGGGDMASFYYPLHAFAAQEIQAGRFPFWNPYHFSGTPHLANFQAATLYPPNVLAYLLFQPFEYANLELLVIGHFLLASYAAYWLGRSLGIGRAGSILTAVVYAYSGFLVAHLGHYTIVATASWAPFVLAALIATIRLDSWFTAILGVIPLAFMILGGHQPTLLMTLTIAAAVVAFELWRGTREHTPNSHWRPTFVQRSRLFAPLVSRLHARLDDRTVASYASILPKLTVMTVLALGLTAPALGPSLELIQHTVRAELDYGTATSFSVQPIALIHLVVPTVFGSNPTDYWGSFSNTEIWGYTGVLALALAAYGVSVRPSRVRIFWLLVAVTSLLYLIGPFASLHGWAYAFVPGYDRIRAAGRAYMFFDLAIAVLAGFGLHALLLDRTQWTPRQWLATKWSTIGLGGALLIVVGFVVPLLASRVLGVNDPGNRPVIALDNVNLLAIWLALGLGVLIPAWRGRLTGRLLAFAVVAVVVVDLFHATAPFNPTTDPILSGYRHPEAVAFLRDQVRTQGPFRILATTAAWQPELAVLAQLESADGAFDPLAIKAYDDYRSAAIANPLSDEMRSLNVRYVITGAEDAAPAPGYEPVLRTTDGLVIWEAPAWNPRAWLEGGTGSVTVSEFSPGRVELQVSTSTGGTLIVSQVNYPGWRATADGAPVTIETFNGVLQAIDLPPGTDTVTLSFQPRAWTLWLAISAISAVLWFVAIPLSLRRGSVGRDDSLA